MDRRRWDKVTAYLERVIEGPTKSERIKLQAAMRLSEILMAQQREEQAERRKVERLERQQQEAAQNASQAAMPEPVATDPKDDGLTDARAVFDQLMRKDGGSNGD